MKRTLAIILSVLMIASALAGCGAKVISQGTTETTAKTETEAQTEAQTEVPAETISYQAKDTTPLFSISDVPEANLDAADADYQLKAPEAGEEIAILHTNYGDISFKFFYEVAPKAVYSFIALAKAGRYDETIFHRITNVATSGIGVVQGGDYTNFNGTGGASAYGEEFGLEVSDYLRNIEGSVAMARRTDPNSQSSQFYINSVENGVLDGQYTVFAQVFDGMDVVKTIAAVKTDASDKPVADVIIKSVEIVAYGE